MGKEVLAIPEQYLADVIRVIRAGLKIVKVPKSVKDNLTEWCADEEEYLKRLEES